jgi:hypothetical protein
MKFPGPLCEFIPEISIPNTILFSNFLYIYICSVTKIYLNNLYNFKLIL